MGQATTIKETNKTDISVPVHRLLLLIRAEICTEDYIQRLHQRVKDYLYKESNVNQRNQLTTVTQNLVTHLQTWLNFVANFRNLMRCRD